jgi:hypothetical protein
MRQYGSFGLWLKVVLSPQVSRPCLLYCLEYGLYFVQKMAGFGTFERLMGHCVGYIDEFELEPLVTGPGRARGTSTEESDEASELVSMWDRSQSQTFL